MWFAFSSTSVFNTSTWPLIAAACKEASFHHQSLRVDVGAQLHQRLQHLRVEGSGIREGVAPAGC